MSKSLFWIALGVGSVVVFSVIGARLLTRAAPETAAAMAVPRWTATCNQELARIDSIKRCLDNYYKMNTPLHDELGVADEREAFERCRASASYQYCKWEYK